MKESARAKINLSLDVVCKREDGYHELSMIMLPLTFHDTLDIELSDHDSYSSDVEMSFDDTNTIVRAVHLMRETYKLNQCFKIHCIKRIPMQAGLAGGSADAAAVLRGINKLCGLEISLNELAALGKQIGADVPFCVLNKPAYVSGIGEKIEPFEPIFDYEIMLVKPKQGVSTKSAFEMLDFKTAVHPPISKIVTALKAGQDEVWIGELGNTLEQSAFQLVPEIDNIKKQLQSDGFDAVLMSGSGSCLFGLTRNYELINKVKSDIRYKECTTIHTNLLKVG